MSHTLGRTRQRRFIFACPLFAHATHELPAIPCTMDMSTCPGCGLPRISCTTYVCTRADYELPTISWTGGTTICLHVPFMDCPPYPGPWICPHAPLWTAHNTLDYGSVSSSSFWTARNNLPITACLCVADMEGFALSAVLVNCPTQEFTLVLGVQWQYPAKAAIA